MASSRRLSSGSACRDTLIGMSSPSLSGATSVWVGSRRFSDTVPPAPTKLSNVSAPRDRGVQSPQDGEGQYMVVSVKDCTSKSLPCSRKSSSALPPFSPASDGASASTPLAGSAMDQHPVTAEALAGALHSLGIRGGMNTGLAAFGGGGPLLPVGSVAPPPLTRSLSLPQPCPWSAESLVASARETLSLTQGGALQTLPLSPVLQPTLLSPLSFAPQMDPLSAALASSQALLSTSVQSPAGVASQEVVSPPCVTGLQLLPLAAVPQDTRGVAHTRPPPPLLQQPPSSAYRARRRAAKAQAGLDIGGRKTHLNRPPSGYHGEGQAADSSFSAPSYLERARDLQLGDLDTGTEGQEGHVSARKVEPCYEAPPDKDTCMKCGKKVYAVEVLGPVKQAVYHRACFTCRVCHTALSLHSYCHSQADVRDLSVYCRAHTPTAD